MFTRKRKHDDNDDVQHLAESLIARFLIPTASHVHVERLSTEKWIIKWNDITWTLDRLHGDKRFPYESCRQENIAYDFALQTSRNYVQLYFKYNYPYIDQWTLLVKELYYSNGQPVLRLDGEVQWKQIEPILNRADFRVLWDDSCRMPNRVPWDLVAAFVQGKGGFYNKHVSYRPYLTYKIASHLRKKNGLLKWENFNASVNNETKLRLLRMKLNEMLQASNGPFVTNKNKTSAQQAINASTLTNMAMALRPSEPLYGRGIVTKPTPPKKSH